MAPFRPKPHKPIPHPDPSLWLSSQPCEYCQRQGCMAMVPKFSYLEGVFWYLLSVPVCPDCWGQIGEQARLLAAIHSEYQKKRRDVVYSPKKSPDCGCGPRMVQLPLPLTESD